MQTTTTYAFRGASVWFIFSFLFLFLAIPFQGQAQQNTYPFSLDLNLGGGLIGNPNVNAAFQPQLGFSYIPDKLGIGLNAGFLSYNPSFDADQYVAGFEEYTSITKSGEKWSSFFIGIGPRFEFGSRLPITFRSSLDLALTYNSPPETSVDFNDPTGTPGGAQLQLSAFGPGDNYSRWSTALRPEFQIQFSPGGSDLIAINLTAGIQHRLTKNEFTYSQKDLSKVRKMDNPEEMFFQFNTAPDIVRSTNPPQTNFFSSVGIKIRFGKSGSRHLHSEGVIHRDIAARNTAPVQGGGDCDDGNPCPHPGDKASQATDYNSSRSNTEGIVNPDDGNDTGSDSTAAPATDYNSSRSNTTSSIMGDPGNGSPGDTTATATDYNSSRSNTTSSASRAAKAQDYNSSRSNRPPTRAAGGGGAGPVRWMAPETIIASGPVSSRTNPLYEGEVRGGKNPVYEGEMNDNDSNESDAIGGIQTYKLAPVSSCLHVSNAARNPNASQSNTEHSGTKASQATDYNSSRSNTEGIVNTGGDNGTGSDSTAAPATDYNSSRSNTTSSIMGDPGNGSPGDTTATATDYNSSRSNKPRSRIADEGDIDADGESTNESPATSHNASRSNRSSGIRDSGLGGDLDGDGFPDVLKGAAFSISKRSARTQRGSEDETGLHFNLMINDPDSDDDGLMDLTETSTFSITHKTPGQRKGNPLYSEEGAAASNPLYESEGAANDSGSGDSSAGPVRMWTYEVNSLSGAGAEGDADLLKGAVLTIIHQNGRWHYDLQINPDPDTDQDGYGDALRNSSFSISKRSARTGRN